MTSVLKAPVCRLLHLLHNDCLASLLLLHSFRSPFSQCRSPFSNQPRTQYPHSNANPRESNPVDPLDLYACNLRIADLARRGDVSTARKIFDTMRFRDVVTYTSMVNAYLKNGDLLLAQKLFREMPARNVVVESSMVNGLAKAGYLDEARNIFDKMTVRNVFSWTSLISGYLRIGYLDEARFLFDEMPDRNVVSWTTMVAGFAKNGLVDEARLIFDQMPEKNVVSWTAMIKAYADDLRMPEARALFDEMPHRNVYSWNVMILGYLDSNQCDEATKLFQRMPSRNTVSWTTMVTGLAMNGLTDRARQFFDSMPNKDVAAWNAMITSYANDDGIIEARRLFDAIPMRNSVTWNAIIYGYIKSGHREEAWRLFADLRCSISEAEKFNEATLTSLLLASEGVDEVWKIHSLALKVGSITDTSLANALVSSYSKCGDLVSSWRVFEWLIAKDSVSWTSMIMAFSDHGCGDHALEVFSRMLRYRLSPDKITFICLLSACSRSGLLQKGRKIFDSMRGGYGLEPDAEHYSCLVDLLGRSGLVEEAKKVVDEMPPNLRDEAVFGALLGACRVHNEIKVSSQLGEDLIELYRAGYASVGGWTDAARVQKIMKERRPKEPPGWSRIRSV